MALIDIVICVSSIDPALGARVEAAAAGHAPVVWLALADVGAPDPDLGAGPADVRVLRARGPGLAAARNAALAASDAEVLAFIEDDVLAGAGWYAALQAAWDGAPERVAAIGGPIELELAGEAPRWFSEPLHPAFATLDYGPAPLALDTASRTLHGGNLSVRCAPLRAIGGFWPAHGHRDGRDWFSEEHHAQRVLAEAGWEVRYEPQARVSRVPSARMLRPGPVLRRRWHYGARMGIVGAPPPAGVALAQCATSAAGAALAVARRQPAVAVDRAARVAQSAGLLLGGPLAARAFRADGPPPFGSRVRAAPRPRRRRRSAQPATEGAAILLYHRVAQPAGADDGMCVAPDIFSQQVAQLAGQPVRALDELAGLARAGRVPAGALAVSFDDGYVDTLVEAKPQLVAAGLPATVFVTTGHVARQRPFFWDELERILLGPGARPPQLTLTSFADGARAWRTDTLALRGLVRRQIHDLLQPAPLHEIEAVIAELSAWCDSEPARDGPRPMTIDELRMLAGDPLIAVGAHTRGHTNLGSQSAASQREEIEGSRDDIAGWLGASPAGFSYPFGIPAVDFDATTRALTADAGFAYAVSNQAGVVGARSDPYALPRHCVPNVGGDAFAAWLQGLLGA